MARFMTEDGFETLEAFGEPDDLTEFSVALLEDAETAREDALQTITETSGGTDMQNRMRLANTLACSMDELLLTTPEKMQVLGIVVQWLQPCDYGKFLAALQQGDVEGLVQDVLEACPMLKK